MRAAAAHRRVAHLADVTAPPGPSSDASGAGSRGRDVPAGAVVVVGGMVLDVQASPGPGASLLRGTTTPGTVRQTPGGVGRNIAEGLFRASPPGAPPPFLLSVVGDDLAGGALLEAWRNLGHTLSAAGVRVCAGAATPAVAAVLDAGGEVAAGVADCDTVEAFLDPPWIQAHAARIAAARVVVLDGNCAPAALAAAVAAARAPSDVPNKQKSTPLVWFEPVSVAKAARVFEAGVAREVDVVSPNLAELRAMARAARRASGRRADADDVHENENENENENESPGNDENDETRDDVDALLDAGIGSVVLTLGALGVVLCRREGNESRITNHASRSRERAPFVRTRVPALPPSAGVRSLVGAGDALVAGSAAALAAGHDLASAVSFGVAAARRAVETDANVPFSGVSFAALAADARDAAAAATTTTT